MDTTFVEYDDNGELFHVSTVSTTEGAVSPLDPLADDDTKKAYAAAVQKIIADKDKAVRDELAAHVAAGKKLIVLPAGAPVPEHGRHRVVNGKIVARTDAELAAFHAAVKAAESPGGGKPTT